MSGLIKNVEESNDPALDKPELPNIKTPVQFNATSVSEFGQPAEQPITLDNNTASSIGIPVPEQAPSLPTINPDLPDNVLTQTQADVTDVYNQAANNITPPSAEPITTEANKPLNVSDINDPGQTPQEFRSSLNLSSTDELLRKGQLDRNLIDETSLTKTHIPTVYSPPESGVNLDFNSSIQRAGVAPGQTPTSEEFNQNFLPSPVDSNAPRTFKPDALAASQFAVNGLAVLDELDRRQGLTGNNTTKPWGDGWLTSALYGLGVLTNTVRGVVIDATRSRMQTNNLIEDMAAKKYGGTLTSLSTSNGNGLLGVRPDLNYKGSYTLDALRGRQYSYTANVNNKNEPIGITGTADGFTDAFVRWNNSQKWLEPITPEQRWVVDPSFWAGLAADVLLDPIDTVSVGVAGIRLVNGARKAASTARRGAVKITEEAGNVVAKKPLMLAPGVELTPNTSTEAIVIKKAGSGDIFSEDRVTGVAQARPQQQISSAESMAAARRAPTKYEVVNTPNGEVQIPVNKPSEPRQLPGNGRYTQPNWTPVKPDVVPRVVDVALNADGTPAAVVEINRAQYWKSHINEVRELNIPEPIDVKYEVVPEPRQLPGEPDRLALAPSKEFMEWDLTTKVTLPDIAKPVNRRIESIAKDVISGRPRPKEFPELTPSQPTLGKVGSEVIALSNESVNIVRTALDNSDFSTAYSELTRLKVKGTQPIRRALESGNIQEAASKLRELSSRLEVKAPVIKESPKFVNKIDENGYIRKRVIDSDGRTRYQRVKANVQTEPRVIVDALTPKPGVTADFTNDALRPLADKTPLVATTNEINQQLSQQLERLTQTEARMKSRGASPDSLESIRKQKLEIRRAIAESLDDDDDVIAPVQKKSEPITPVVNKFVFTGTMKYSEVAKELLNNTPGHTVNSVSRVDRKLTDIEALMRTIPDPRTGKPFLKDGGRFFKSWSKESSNSPFAYLQRIGVDDPQIYRMFEREGAAIDVNSLTSPDFRVVVDEALPGKVSKQVVVDNTPKAAAAITEPVDVKSMTLVELQKERNRLTKALYSAEDPTELIDKLTEVDSALGDYKSMLDNPKNVEILQKSVIPDTMHGTSPEVLELTAKKLEVSEELSDIGSHVQELEIQAASLKETISEAIANIEKTADILPVDVIDNTTINSVNNLGESSVVDGQTLYHGTRVNNWSPNNGGIGEWGSGTYYSSSSKDAVNHALKPSREALSESVSIGKPTVHEVVADFKKVIDVNSQPTGEFLAETLQGVYRSVNNKKEFYSFRRSVIDELNENKFKGTIKNVNDVYSAIEKFGVKFDKTPEQVNAIKSSVNERLASVGYDAITDGSTTMSLLPERVSKTIDHAIDETDAVGTATSNYNAMSRTAEANPEIPTANAAQAESAIMLQRQMYEDTLIKLEEAKRLQRESIIKAHSIDDELLKVAAKEQATTKANTIRDGQKTAERQAERLNKPSNDPCKF